MNRRPLILTIFSPQTISNFAILQNQNMFLGQLVPPRTRFTLRTLLLHPAFTSSKFDLRIWGLHQDHHFFASAKLVRTNMKTNVWYNLWRVMCVNLVGNWGLNIILRDISRVILKALDTNDLESESFCRVGFLLPVSQCDLNLSTLGSFHKHELLHLVFHPWNSNKGLSIYYVIQNGGGVFPIYYNIT